jgi:mannose-6-phosphate isomerase-like protein (cupin superfamily)
MISNVGNVKKGWGQERIWVSNDQYCGKFLDFNERAKFSMHFHANKIESWYCLSGKFMIERIDTNTAATITKLFEVGNVMTIFPLEPHRITCLEAGSILEISTPDNPADNFRVAKGDSQK